MSTTGTFSHPEKDLARELGLSHKALKKLRASELTVRDHWAQAGLSIVYSDAGKARLLELIKNSAGESPAAAGFTDLAPNSAPAAALAAPMIAQLVCTKRYPINRRMVEASHEGKTVRVRVRENIHFRPGMSMRCQLVGEDLWELAQRCPRWPGKW